jgi:hypothetical protein
MRKLICALALSAIVGASPAFAEGTGTVQPMAHVGPVQLIPQGGTMSLKPQRDWAQAVPDKELGEMRGGFFNLAFSAVLTAFIENGSGDLASAVNVQVGDSPTLPTPSELISQNGEVRVANFIGTLNNVSGILTFIQAGNNNTIVTHLTVNAAVIHVGSQSQVPSLQSLFVQP